MSKAEETFVTLDGGERGNLRFARNSATTSGASSGYNLGVTASFGKKSRHGDDRRVRRCEPAARGAERGGDRAAVAREPGAMPVLGPQKYVATKAYFEDVAGGHPRVAGGGGRDRDRAEQAEGGRLRRLRRHVRRRSRRSATRRACSATIGGPRPTTT